MNTLDSLFLYKDETKANYELFSDNDIMDDDYLDLKTFDDFDSITTTDAFSESTFSDHLSEADSDWSILPDASIEKKEVINKQKTSPLSQEDKNSILLQRLKLPKRIASLWNNGDLDAISALVHTHFAPDCILKTDSMKTEVSGTHHIFQFFLRTAEHFPDGLMELRKCLLGKRGDVVFSYKLVGTSMCKSPGFTNEYLIPQGRSNGSVCPFGTLTKKILQASKKHVFPCEKERLQKAEMMIASGQSLPYVELLLNGQIAYQRINSTNPKVTKMEFAVKIRSLKAVPFPETESAAEKK